MDFAERLNSLINSIVAREAGAVSLPVRFRAEVEFARSFSELFPERKEEWRCLILRAAELVDARSLDGCEVDYPAVVKEAEAIMAPIGQVAKDYTIHCCGHAHIDMNWMWSWPETVSTCHDTFATVGRLMREFPEFHFSQSQASVYAAMEEHCPEVFEMIAQRVKEGRWEPMASMWVEGDKNLASGESLCRHMLYTKRYLKDRFGLPYDSIKIDWEPDGFGHAYTLPSILNRGGVSRYYHCRTGPDLWLCWWQAPDKSRVLLFLDKAWYNGSATSRMSLHMVDYVKETGLKDFLFVYGVGDHGGGPTRKDLMAITDMGKWPVYPRVVLSTTEAYFSSVEEANPELPVFDGELNTIFEGCYTSQSNIKRANRVSENVIPEVEALSIVVGAAAGFAYPQEQIRGAWRKAMFNQFHDILPGSGIQATYEYSQGLFQEIVASTTAIRTRALRQLAAAVDTSATSGLEPSSGVSGASIGVGFGAGAGYPGVSGGVSAWNSGAVNGEPVLVYNHMPFVRSEVVTTKVWDKEFPRERAIVRDESGDVTIGQVTETGTYWGHSFTTVAFLASDVPAMGYKVYTLDLAPEAVNDRPDSLITDWLGERQPSLYVERLPIKHEVRMVAPGVMENEFVSVEVDFASGAIKHLVDKTSGYDLVPEGSLMGVLEFCREAPNAMTAWTIGPIQKTEQLTEGGCGFGTVLGCDLPMEMGAEGFVQKQEIVQNGPHRCAVRIGRKLNDSRITVEIGLSADSPAVDFKIVSDWREIGTPDTGVPMLRIAFPTRISEPRATYEIPFGSIERPVSGKEVPALKWADLSGNRVDSAGQCGITLVNADKYGNSADGSTLRLTLIRSSYGPDPLPELGHHEIRLAVMPHDGLCSASDATRAGASFNLPMSVVSTDIHRGPLSPSKGFVEVLTSNVMLAAVKKAEDSDAVMVRLYEMEGKPVEARVRISEIVKPGASVTEVDLIEQPVANSSARMEDDTLVVKLPAHGIASVMVG